MGKAFMGNRVGEINTATNGQKMTIIAYRKSKDIDIQFEDGTILQHRQYQEFKHGWVKNPSIIAKSHIGETNTAKNGQKMTIIAWRTSKDIAIEFEDGTKVYHKKYYAFCEGYVKNPNVNYDCNMQRSINAGNRHVGETRVATNGLKMTLIAYRTSADVDVQFEDGVVVTNKNYSCFVQGRIGHPKITLPSSHLNDRTGESTIALNGLKATIAEYQNSTTMRVRFETGYLTDNTQYIQFKRHMIHHPFPYQLGNVSIEKPAYIYNDVGNFYCRCNTCHKADILTIQEIKEHRCEV